MTLIEGPRGTYRPCLFCRAPILDPFPETWEIEIVKEGPPTGPVKTFITPHAEQCDAPYADPQPGIALRLPGGSVASLAFGPPKVAPARESWQPLGHSDAGPRGLSTEPLITDPDDTGTFQVAGVSVTAEGRMQPDTIAILSGLDPAEILPGESVAQALVRLNRVAAFRLDPPGGQT